MGFRAGWHASIWQAAAVLALITPGAQAQSIAPDGSLGTIVSPGPNFTITGGTPVGTNLFHSFDRFSLATGESAIVNNGTATLVFARVTGGSISSIDGLFGTQTHAGLFLLNPSGIILGPNAALNLNGSFLATTANSIQFADGRSFDLTTPAGLLSMTLPTGLQMGLNPTEVAVRPRSVDLTPGPAHSIALVGGDVSLEAASIMVDGGRISLAALAGGTTIGLATGAGANGIQLQIPDGTPGRGLSIFNGAQLQGGSTSIASLGGGGIDLFGAVLYIYANNRIEQRFRNSPGLTGNDITLTSSAVTGTTIGLYQNSRIVSEPGLLASDGTPGAIRVKGVSLNLVDGSWIGADAAGAQAAGPIDIQTAGSVYLSTGGSYGPSGIYSNARNTATVGAGTIAIQANDISLFNGSQIQARSSGQGNGGTIAINAVNQVQIWGLNGTQSSRISTELEASGVGQAGAITVRAGALDLFDGAEINASSLGRGDAGPIDIATVSDMQLRGSGPAGPSRISSELVAQEDGRRSGNIIVKARNLVSEGGLISTTMYLNGYQAQGGTIDLTTTADLTLTDSPSNYPASSGLIGLATTGSDGGAGSNAGAITVRARNLTLANGAVINSNGGGSGTRSINAGAIDIRLTEDALVGGERLTDGMASGIAAQFVGDARGNSAPIRLDARNLTLKDGGFLATATSGNNAGNLTFNIQNATQIEGRSSNRISGLYTGIGGDPLAGRSAGKVDLTTGTLTMIDGLISTESFTQGNAGDIAIKASGAIDIQRSLANGQPLGLIADVQDQAIGDGGQIAIEGQSLTLSGGALVSSSARAQGNAGSVTLRLPGALTIDGAAGPTASGIIAGAALPQSLAGGLVDIQAGSLSLTNGGEISVWSAGQGKAGSIVAQIQGLTQIEGAHSLAPSGLFADRQGNALGTGSESPLDPLAGRIQLTTQGLSLSNTGLISANNNLPDRGDAGTIAIDSTGPIELTSGRIGAASTAGNGGQVDLSGGNVTLLDGVISTSSKVNGGRISLNTQDLALSGSIEANSVGTGIGGQITVNATGALRLDRGQILAEQRGSGATAGTIGLTATELSLSNDSQISADALGAATAGTITVTTAQITALNNGDISALSESGTAGFIDLAVITLTDIEVRDQRTAGNDITIGRPIANPIDPVAPEPGPGSGPPSSGPPGAGSPGAGSPGAGPNIVPGRPQGIRLRIPNAELFYGSLAGERTGGLRVNNQAVKADCESLNCVPVGQSNLTFDGFCMERYSEFVVTGRGVAPSDPRKPLRVNPQLWWPEGPRDLPRSIGRSVNQPIEQQSQSQTQSQAQTSGLTLAPCQT
jgi:filamentous hemagglutinin family protein